MRESDQPEGLSRDSYLLDTSRFAEVGLSEDFSAWVQRRGYPVAWKRRVHWQFGIVGIGLLLSFFAGIAGHFVLWNWLAEERTREAGATFHYDHSGLGYLLVAVFAVILAAGAAVTWVQDNGPPDKREHDVLGSLILFLPTPGLNGYLSRKFYKWAFRDLGILPLAQQFEELARINRAFYGAPLKVLGGLVLILFVRDFRDYSLATPAGFTTHDTWTTASVHSSWQDLDAVRVGCWVSDKDGLQLSYVTHFKNGTEVNLLHGRPHLHDLAMAEFADERAHERGIKKEFETFNFGIHRGEAKKHEGCADAIDAKYPQEVADSLYALLTPR